MAGCVLQASSTVDATSSYIVQGINISEVQSIVSGIGGEITHELGLINAVAAALGPSQVERLRNAPGISRILANGAVTTAGKGGKSKRASSETETTSSTTETDATTTTDTPGDAYSQYPSLVDADRLHAEGITGWGVTVAVLDSGIYSGPGLSSNTYGDLRIAVAYDATTDTEFRPVSKRKSRSLTGLEDFDNDDNGHGSHIASTGFNSKLSNEGKFNGVAPDVKLVSVKVFDASGVGTYADVIRGVEWVVANQANLRIRVMNMSLSAPAQSQYWDDPLNQAVMAAWRAGVVVVASAGNGGPDAQSIGVPGNVPYIITVGAMTDNYTPADGGDDELASFSAVGPTYEGFVKPEVVAPGGHIMAAMQEDSAIALEHPEFHNGASFFTMSGTSQATAVVSGIAALVLQMEPALTPDEVKCKIMSSARPAVNSDGSLAYSVFQQGAGLVNAYDAAYKWNYDCANKGLDIDADVAGTKHFGGRANQDASGSYYLMGLDGYLWTNGSAAGSGYLWTDAYLWSDGYLWTNAYLWTNGSANANGYMWTDSQMQSNGYLWTDGYLWTNGLTETMSINSWVEPE
ncbi:MAG: S8 family peptidase [Woeseia sp.]|nr:S8 family peptidase [Gammaproteobacteria bacterium]NNC56783.1 S8 family peptidase [Woeseiaceae bacterium]NNE59667.1 S8 family peptidase [Woeseia sp.]NNL50919.1 S8 family peptidase [Woeseiaceae bacterium]